MSAWCLREQRAAVAGDDAEVERLMRMLFDRLDEHQRRWFAGLESTRLGYGGDRRIAAIVGMDEKTVRRGRRELSEGLTVVPAGRARRPRRRSLPLAEAYCLAEPVSA